MRAALARALFAAVLLATLALFLLMLRRGDGAANAGIFVASFAVAGLSARYIASKLHWGTWT